MLLLCGGADIAWCVLIVVVVRCCYVRVVFVWLLLCVGVGARCCGCCDWRCVFIIVDVFFVTCVAGFVFLFGWCLAFVA